MVEHDVEASPTPTSTLKCSLVRVGSSLLASGSGEGSGSGYGWLYPDNFTLQASAGLEDPLDQEYSLVCDSLQASTHSEEISNAFPSSIVSTTLATFTIESAPVSSYLPPTVKSVFNSVIPIPTPDPDNIVEIRLALSASQHESLQDSGSPERAALEIALANEYLQTLNTSSGRAKRQTQPSVTAKVRETVATADAIWICKLCTSMNVYSLCLEAMYNSQYIEICETNLTFIPMNLVLF